MEQSIEASTVIEDIKSKRYDEAKKQIKNVKNGDPNVSSLLYWVVECYNMFSPADIPALLAKGADLNYHKNGEDTLCSIAGKEYLLFEWILTRYKSTLSFSRFSGSTSDIPMALLRNRQAPESKIIELFQQMLGRKVILSNRDEWGDSLLHITAYRGYLNAYLVLLALGLDPEAKNKRDETTYAVLEKYTKMIPVVKAIKEFRRKPRERTLIAENMSSLTEWTSPEVIDILERPSSNGNLPTEYETRRIASFMNNLTKFSAAARIPGTGNGSETSASAGMPRATTAVDYNSEISYSEHQSDCDTDNAVADLLPSVVSENELSNVPRPQTVAKGTIYINNDKDASHTNATNGEKTSYSTNDESKYSYSQSSGSKGVNNTPGEGITPLHIINTKDEINVNGYNNLGAPVSDSGCTCCAGKTTFRDQVCNMFDTSMGCRAFCRNSILGFSLMAALWIVMIGLIFIGSLDKN